MNDRKKKTKQTKSERTNEKEEKNVGFMVLHNFLDFIACAMHGTSDCNMQQS